MKKMLPWLVSLLLAITLIVIVALYFWSSLFGSDAKDPEDQARESVQSVAAEPMSADEMIKVTSELTNIQTNIADTDYVVRISLSFQMDSAKAKEEFDKIKDIQVKPLINRALWVLNSEDVKGTKGKDQLCAELINAINPVLSEGKLTSVKITDFIISPI
ncbi:flagellar basal body-associated FliL family protein [Cohnella faecalis]|uniref:Flagellar protein FliL n=1 Tax=Cohnella faecalis TaxID=2315694 RepID=A0A398CM17_9BACL|nr:flagellar basal body-associated FliL family protein [Cohnella faecalis]RIE03292.1 flagellar basal body protein FliL [Cohnella faecalis]